MTRDRRRKQDVRALRDDSDPRYTRARRRTASAPGASMRDYTGEIYICTSCGQPAYAGVSGPSHFAEQDGGVFCPAFPAASGLLRTDWDAFSLGQVREEYPHPVSRTLRQTRHADAFQTYADRVVVCAHCGQPAFYDSEVGMRNFTNQWDGVHCPRFPLAGETTTVRWHPRSLADWKAGYVCTDPRTTG